MNGNFMRSQGLLAVAVGAGVVIGAAGIFLYEHIFKEKRRLILQKDVTKLGISISELKRELQELRDAQKKIRRSRTRTVTSVTTEGESEAQSVVEDLDDDEFYDLSDEEEINEANVNDDNTSAINFKEIDSLIIGPEDDKKRCLETLEEMYNQDNNNTEVLWRLAKCCHSISIQESENDIEKKKDYIAKGLEYATKCLELAPRSSDAHKWYAICIGARSESQGVKEKLKDGLEFKEHVEEALKIKPSDPTLHHLLGRFLFEVASLSWVERKVATTLFGEVPYATYPEAVESLTKAEELSVLPWKENRLLLAKCYIQIGEYSEALYWLDKADEVKTVTKEDYKAEGEISSLKKKYQHHRGLI